MTKKWLLTETEVLSRLEAIGIAARTMYQGAPSGYSFRRSVALALQADLFREVLLAISESRCEDPARLAALAMTTENFGLGLYQAPPRPSQLPAATACVAVADDRVIDSLALPVLR